MSHCIQRLHPATEVSILMRRQQQVEMVCHQTRTCQPHRHLLVSLPHQVHKRGDSDARPTLALAPPACVDHLRRVDTRGRVSRAARVRDAAAAGRLAGGGLRGAAPGSDPVSVIEGHEDTRQNIETLHTRLANSGNKRRSSFALQQS